MKLKGKSVLFLANTLLFGVGSLLADDMQNTCDKSTPPTKICVPPGQYSCECGPTVYVAAAYTLWTAREQGLPVAISNYSSVSTVSAAIGKVFYPEFKLRSGFKVALGTYLPHDNWDMRAEYTWFNNNSNKIKDLGVPANTTINVWTTDPASLQTTLSSAAARWKNFYNRIDGQLGRTFYAGHYLTLRPFLGLIGAWDKQRFDINYVVTGTTAPVEIRTKQTWWGVGPYGGFDTTFTFFSACMNQWSLFIDTGTALAWGNFKTKESLANASGNNILYFSNSLSNVSPMLELALGLRWETWWADDSWMFLLQAGWDLQAWFNHNQLSTTGTNGGLFSLQGFTLKAQIGF